MDIAKVFRKGKKISMVTCYDYSFASFLNQSNIDSILVGDSLANVLLGESDTRKVSVDEMANHTASVCRGAPNKVIVVDLPYVACQKKSSRPLEVSRRFIKSGAKAVKVEWFGGCRKVISQLTRNNIPVMGHIGLTPQTAHLLGGYKVQGRKKHSADKLLRQAKELQELGVFSLVLECIQGDTAKEITRNLDIPTIGIGAGKDCDGQVLVLYDLLGLYPSKMRFVRVFANLGTKAKEAVNSFDQQVKTNNFPTDKESF